MSVCEQWRIPLRMDRKQNLNIPVCQRIKSPSSKSTFIGIIWIYRVRLVLLILVMTMRRSWPLSERRCRGWWSISWGAGDAWQRRGWSDQSQRRWWSRRSACTWIEICVFQACIDIPLVVCDWSDQKTQAHLLLMEKGRLSPGAGRPSPPRLERFHTSDNSKSS